MKQFSFLLATILMSLSLLAQTPSGINYQTVIRDGAGDILPDTELTLQMIIRSGAPDGAVVYQETHDATTNAFGLVNLVIGSGIPQSGTFEEINWGADAHYLETSADLDRSKDFQVLGVTQFLSVPYSLYSKEVESLKNGTYNGEILFWYEDEWATIPPGAQGQTLVFCDSVPTWGGCLPIVHTSEVDVISFYLATSGGNVINDGGNPVFQRGVCWSTSPNPTVDNNEGSTQDGNGTGVFESTLNNLVAETNYYIRAYAINSRGVGYGQEIAFTTLPDYFTCGDILIDERDSMQYATVQIGSQCWMAENLAYLPSVNSGEHFSSTSAMYYVYEYFGSNVSEAKATDNYQNYGVLYNWHAAINACPVGWRLAASDDYRDLSMFHGGNFVAGGKLKSTRTKPEPHPRWLSPNTGATNESQFSALPGGHQSPIGGGFGNLERYAFLLASDFNPDQPSNPYAAMLQNNAIEFVILSLNPPDGLSARCVWDYSQPQNHPPVIPFNPSPTNGAENQALDIVLSWFCNDPENDPIIYDVHLGTNENPPLLINGISDNLYLPDSLDYGITYYWKIVAHDNMGNATEGNVWSFKTMEYPGGTGNQPPISPYNPIPIDGSTNQSNSILFTWNCFDSDGDSISYDVYFGTNEIPPLIVNNLNVKEYSPETLDYGTKYYWKIQANDDKGNSSYSPLWSFSTIFDPSWGCGDSLYDNRDGFFYNTVQIGDQCWMAENLSFLPSVNPIADTSINDPKYYVYDYQGTSVLEAKATDNYQNYGVLYNLTAAVNVCPSGWNLPSTNDWQILRNHLGGSYMAAGKMKSTRTEPDPHPRWNSPNTNATNESLFSAIPGGFLGYWGQYEGIGSYGCWWLLTESAIENPFILRLSSSNTSFAEILNAGSIAEAASVRCLKDVDSGQNIFNLFLHSSPEDAGSVMGEGQYESGEQINITAEQNPGWEFVNWTDDDGIVSEAESFTYTMPAEDVTLTANFIEEQTSFTCGDPLIDTRDGQTYETVLIGDQCWMAENLNIGTRINGSSNQTNNGTIEKYCYNNSEANCDIYGGLYQWNEMMGYTTTPGVQGICPEGWHLPTDAEWTALTTYISSQPEYLCNSNTSYIAKALAATTNWNSSSSTCAVGNNPSTNNATGFSGLPGGYRSTSGNFDYVGDVGIFWSSTESSTTYAWYRGLNYNDANVGRDNYTKGYGFSVRCLRD
jgi:uncharacterized protein (TIGR02145 family)/uncharacterized repeat protein (TIGR02543 family)